jgi:ankyrin repeat protein
MRVPELKGVSDHRLPRFCGFISLVLSCVLMAGCGPSSKGIFQKPIDVALADAAARGDTRGIDSAIANGADFNVQGKGGITPLRFAYDRRNLKGYRYLLEKGANPNILDARKRCIVNETARNEESSVWLQLALEHGGDPNIPSNETITPSYTVTPMWDALFSRTPANVDLLIRHGANLNATNDIGSTVTCDAAFSRSPTIARLLLERGADWTIRDKHGIDVAAAELHQTYSMADFPDAARDHEWVLNFLRQNGVDMEDARTRSEKWLGKPN